MPGKSHHKTRPGRSGGNRQSPSAGKIQVIAMPASFVMLFLSIIGTAEGLENGFLVSQNETVVLPCHNGLENTTRIRWEFISTNGNTNETIYDSESNKILKAGFEVSCEPLTSTCNLKLIRAREEDSGKFICYVGEGSDAKFDTKLLKLFTANELVVRGSMYKTMVVRQGDSVILPCEHNIKNLTRLRWSHVSLQGFINYNLYQISSTKATNNNYEGLCKAHEPSCNLKIFQAREESAGHYICAVGESFDFKKKYGLFQITSFIEIQLVVGELLCNDDMDKELAFIGENDCYGMEADVLNLKCSFNYFGNVSYNFFHLRWIEKFNSSEKRLNSSLINHEVQGGTKKISIQANLSVAYEMQNLTFQCILDNTLVKPCQLQEIKTQYVKNNTERYPPIYSNELHSITCSANKSENVHCSYYWVHEIGGALIESPYAVIPVENMNSPGNYTCIAKCYIGKQKECIIKAMEFEVLESYHSDVKEGMIIALFVIIFILAMPYVVMLFFFLKKRYLKQRRKYDRTHSKKYDDENISLKDLSNKDIEAESQYASPLLHSTANSLIRRRFAPFPKNEHEEQKGLIEVSSFPLDVNQILEENRFENVMVKIYKSENPIHDRVLMIDPVLWDTSCEKFSSLEIITRDVLRCHLRPEKVLVIGTCEGRIVKALLNHKDVDSISVCEANHDHRKELNRLYHDYFPEMASHLDHAKVHKLDEGIKFLSDQKNEFDVIITHSTSSRKRPLDYLFSYKYLESVRTALARGGIYLLIVSGEDLEPNTSRDFVKYEIKSLCKQFFPGVNYFQLQYFRLNTHPSCLTRCLLCGLNPGEIFEVLYKDVFQG